MNNLQLIKQHHDDCIFCSMMSHMRDVSTTYVKILIKGDSIVPDILKFIRDEENSGMSEMMLLWDIKKWSPYEPEKKNGFAAFEVDEAKKAWIEWGKKEGLI